MALHTGMRRGEIFDLKWKEVDFEREVIDIPHTKTYKSRVVIMNGVILHMLKGLREDNLSASDSSYVFASEKTGGRLNNIKHVSKPHCERQGSRISDSMISVTLPELGWQTPAFTLLSLRKFWDIRNSK